jgi:hypothetical protein
MINKWGQCRRVHYYNSQAALTAPLDARFVPQKKKKKKKKKKKRTKV